MNNVELLGQAEICLETYQQMMEGGTDLTDSRELRREADSYALQAIASGIERIAQVVDAHLWGHSLPNREPEQEIEGSDRPIRIDICVEIERESILSEPNIVGWMVCRSSMDWAKEPGEIRRFGEYESALCFAHKQSLKYNAKINHLYAWVERGDDGYGLPF